MMAHPDPPAVPARHSLASADTSKGCAQAGNALGGRKYESVTLSI
jgi:hypothetical protein